MTQKQHPPRQKPSGYQAWVDLAERRILNVLRTRITANIRQLEVKISESGPPGFRPEPHIITDALKSLRARGLVRRFTPSGEGRRQETLFYTLPEYYPEKARNRVRKLLVPYHIYRTFTDEGEYCARVLEGIVRKSFDASRKYKFLGKLPKQSPLDGVYSIGSEKIGMDVDSL